MGLSLGALALLVASGCQTENIKLSGLSAEVPPAPETDLDVPGTEMVAEPDVVNPSLLAQNKTYGVRSNPFALLGAERIFHNEQMTERFIADFGGWVPFDVPPDIRIPQPPVIPLPQWRLSGVIIGNGVLALLDTGSTVYEIRPGMTIPGTEWRVASIDSERAILVRDNAVPSEFRVVLQGVIGGGTGFGTGGGANTAPGGNTGGDTGIGAPGGLGGGG